MAFSLMRRQPLPPTWGFSRRDLTTFLDLIAAGFVVQVFFDQWIAAFLNEYRDAPLVLLVSFLPDGFQLVQLFTIAFLFFVSYRITAHDSRLADRGLFVLGGGIVSGGATDFLKLVFGRLRPDAFVNDGMYGFNFLAGRDGFDSFPSTHAAVAAGLAGALVVLWPEHRRIFFSLGWAVTLTRVLTGRHFPSDAIIGFAVGLGAVIFVRALFAMRGIKLQPQDEAKK